MISWQFDRERRARRRAVLIADLREFAGVAFLILAGLGLLALGAAGAEAVLRHIGAY